MISWNDGLPSDAERDRFARVAHETNRAYCATLGDTSQLAWDDAPEWQRTSALNGVAFHLVALHDGQAPSPSASHDNWLEEKRADGWTFGPVKDPAKKEHPCFVPYDESGVTPSTDYS